MLSNVQLGEYVEHIQKHDAIRKKVDDALMKGDVDAEWQGRQQLKEYWSKVPKMYSELLKSYNGDQEKMMTDVRAYRLLKDL